MTKKFGNDLTNLFVFNNHFKQTQPKDFIMKLPSCLFADILQTPPLL